MNPKDYTVIIYPPVRRDVHTTTTNVPRVVKVARCMSPKEAANKANVPPGGRCAVVVAAEYFTRAEEAPLEEVDAGFNALPQAAHA